MSDLYDVKIRWLNAQGYSTGSINDRFKAYFDTMSGLPSRSVREARLNVLRSMPEDTPVGKYRSFLQSITGLSNTNSLHDLELKFYQNTTNVFPNEF